MAHTLNKRVSPSRKNALFEDWFTLGQLSWRKERCFGSLQVNCLPENSSDNLLESVVVRRIFTSSQELLS